jgi:phosphohistidine swiveling domain-containing protein
MLPQLKLFGRELARSRAARARGDTLHGVAASPGRVTATARVLHAPEEFSQMQAGDVLVAAITTPAWTPLFAMASAIVTDVGGPLSHGSIVAREYGIPAVLGTGVATRRVQSGQLVHVDGDAGTVTLLDGTQPATAIRRSRLPAVAAAVSPTVRQVVVLGLLAGMAIGAAIWLSKRRYLPASSMPADGRRVHPHGLPRAGGVLRTSG